MTVKLQLQNKIMNGAFDFWQRGSSVADSVSNGYLADRFVGGGSAGVVALAKDADVPVGAFANSSAAFTVTTAPTFPLGAAAYRNYSQRIEGNVLRTFKGKKMVLRFWVKATVPGPYSIFFGDPAIGRGIVKDYVINSANTWEQKTVRFTHDTTGSWDYGNGLGAYLTFFLGSGTDRMIAPDVWSNVSVVSCSTNQTNGIKTVGDVFKLTDIVLVEDSEGLSREPDFMYAGRDYFEELTLCQRYYEKSYELDTAPATATAVNELYFWGPTTVSTVAWFRWASIKRVAPTMQFWSRNGVLGQWLDSTLAARSVDASVPRTTGFNMSVTPGGTNRQLHGHFAADAEL